MNLQSSDFELFGVPEQFAQDMTHISARWKELQNEAHPDKFVARGDADRRLAMQWSVRINEAYQRLKDPLKRASYLCERHSHPINAETNTTMPGEFLMQQMELRELLDDAETVKDFEKILAQSICSKHQQLSKIEQLIDAQKNFKAAAQEVRCLMFIERFASEVDSRIDQVQS